jgi:hypothetical protein
MTARVVRGFVIAEILVRFFTFKTIESETKNAQNGCDLCSKLVSAA